MFPSSTAERARLLLYASMLWICVPAGSALQIQCYQCEEVRSDDCSSPEYIVNCTVNVQDMCQKEVLITENGVQYRKSCASSGACLIASSGYQQFCTGKLNSVCITCCSNPLCNGPHQRRRPTPSAAAPVIQPLALLPPPPLLLLTVLPLLVLHQLCDSWL